MAMLRLRKNLPLLALLMPALLMVGLLFVYGNMLETLGKMRWPYPN